MLTKFEKVTTREGLEDGKALVVKFGREEVCLVRWDGKFFAFANTCPHMDAPMQWGYIQEGYIECPWHGYRYDLTTGARLRIPRADSLELYPIRIVGDDVYVGPRPPNASPAGRAEYFG